MSSWYWIWAVILTADISLVTSGKQDRLSLLVMMGFTGNPPTDGKGCLASAQIAIDAVNNRTDILPDYYIDASFVDEAYGNLIAKVLVDYTRSFENNGRPGLFQSPVVIGSTSSNGCKAIGPFLHHVYSVDMSFACAAPFLTDRTVHRNLYLMRATGRFLSFPMLHFAKSMGWKRIAIITNAASVFDYSSAIVLFQTAPLVGVTVSFFDILLDFGDVTMLALKENDARVIVVFTSSKALIFRFMCQAMKFGITGSKYVFFLLGIAYGDPYDLPLMVGPDCPRSTIVEQTKYSFWFAPIMSTDNPYLKSEFGYNQIEYDATYDRNTKSFHAIDYDQRYLCHDTTLQGLLVLDRAERALRNKNMSLKDYKDFPEKVMHVVNETAIKIDYIGLRKGRMRYNKRGEVDAEIHAVWYWSPERRMQWLYMLYQFENASGYDYNGYYAKKLAEPTWMTRSGKPPFDGWRRETVLAEVPFDVFIVILVFAGICAVVHLLMMAKTVYLRNDEMIAQGMVSAKLIGYISCLVLDAAAIVYAWETSGNPVIVSWLRIVLLTIGFAGTNSVLGCRVMLLYQRIRTISNAMRARDSKKSGPHSASIAHHMHMTSVGSQHHISSIVAESTHSNHLGSPRESNIQPLSRPATRTTGKFRMSIRLVQEDVLAVAKACIRGSFEFALTSAVIIVSWLGSQQLQCSAKKERTTYVEAEDKIVDTFVTTCLTPNFSAWVLTLVAKNLLILIIGGYFAFKLRYFHGAASCPEFGLIKLGLVNASTIFCAGLLLVIIIGNPIGQQIVIGFATLVYAFTTSATWAFPLLRK